MVLDNEVEQGVTQESPAPDQESNSSENNAPAAAESAQPQSQQPQTVPYERFQELVHARQQSDAQVKAYEERLAKMERDFQEKLSQVQQPQKQAHPLIEKMREIDPKYAEYLEGLESKTSTIEQLQQKLQQFENAQLRSQYENSISTLHEQNKTPEGLRSFIKEVLDARALSGQIKSIDQVKDAYKAAFEGFSKLLETTKRETTKSYVQDKSKDSSAPPSQPKGTPASGKKEFKGSREELMAEIAKNVVKRTKAERDL